MKIARGKTDPQQVISPAKKNSNYALIPLSICMWFKILSPSEENPESARSVYAIFSAHSAYFNVSRQKVLYFNVSRQTES